VIVGLTGGIGSGKSEVAKLLAERGAVIVDTDAIARDLVEPHGPLLSELVREFGASIVGPEGRLDRRALARIAFADEGKRKRLNDILHPAILKQTLAEISRHASSAVVVVVVPLLFESGFDKNCQTVIAVVAPVELRRRRVLDRGGMDETDLAARIRAQLPDAEYERRAQIVVRNDGDQAKLGREVDAAWGRLKTSPTL